MKKFIGRILLFIVSSIVMRFKITNLTNRLIDKLVIMSGK